MKFSTKTVHVGADADPITGAMMAPIFMTSTFRQEAPGVTKGYDYTRAGNPNFTHLEDALAALEGGKYATVFSSGIGALASMITTLNPGDRVIGIDGVYGGTYRLFDKIFKPHGIVFEILTPESLGELEAVLATGPKWLLFETPTNPLLDVFDIEAFAAIAKKHGVMTIVDNTFATPCFQNPLSLGADIVWHSTTKYVGGHSDVIGGALITDDPKLKEVFDFRRMSLGTNPSPFDAWLIHRGLKTLALRMERHQENAMAIANHLVKHPKVKKVYYPGLEGHPGHAIAKKQMHGFSGVVSVEFDLSLEDTKKLISSFEFFSLAESLGGVESLVDHPAIMTHASIPADERKKMHITDGLVRFSVGIEDKDDLIKDIDRALQT